MGLRVGNYQQQTEAQAAPAVRMGRLPDNGVSSIAQGMGDVANTLAGIQQAEAAKMDKVRIDDAINQSLMESVAKKQQIANMKGKAALQPGPDGGSPFQPLEQQWNANTEEILKGLGNDRQREAVKSYRAQQYAHIAAFTFAHQDQEMKSYTEDVHKGTIATNQALVQTDPLSEKTYATSRAAIAASFRNKAAIDGTPEELLKPQIAAADSALLAARLVALTDPKTGNIPLAKQLLKDNANVLVGDHKHTITKLVEDAASQFDVQKLADQITSENPADADARARELTKSDPSILPHLRRELDYRHTKDEARSDDAIGGYLASYERLPGSTPMSARDIWRDPGVLNMTPADRVKLHDRMVMIDKRNKGEEDPNVTINRFIKSLELTDNKAALVNMTDQQIASMGLGPQLTQHVLLSKRQAAGQLSTLQNVNMPAADFNTALDENGIKYKGTLNNKQRAELGAFKAEFSTRAAEKQMQLQRPLNEQEFRQLIDLMGKEVVVSKGAGSGLFGMYESTDKKKLWQVENFGDIQATPDEKFFVSEYLRSRHLTPDKYKVQMVLDKLRASKADPVTAANELTNERLRRVRQ